MKKLAQGIYLVISLCCIAFTAFFVISTFTGNTEYLSKIEAGMSKAAQLTGLRNSSSDSSGDASTSTLSMLKKDFGLTTSQAGQIMSMANQLGVDTENPAEMRNFIAKNAGNSAEIKDVANKYQNGEISEAQARSMLAGVVEL